MEGPAGALESYDCMAGWLPAEGCGRRKCHQVSAALVITDDRWLKSEINRIGEEGGRAEAEVSLSHDVADGSKNKLSWTLSTTTCAIGLSWPVR